MIDTRRVHHEGAVNEFWPASEPMVVQVPNLVYTAGRISARCGARAERPDRTVSDATRMSTASSLTDAAVRLTERWLRSSSPEARIHRLQFRPVCPGQHATGVSQHSTS